MKFFYIMANQFLTLLLSPNTLTSLHFNEQIQYCDTGVSKSALIKKYRRQKTTITLAPFTKINTNMTCFMKSGKVYVFNIRWSNDKYHKNIVVNDASLSKGGVVVLDNNKFRLFDSGRGFFIENKTDKKIIVNEMPVKHSSAISKWSPITIDGKEYRL